MARRRCPRCSHKIAVAVGGGQLAAHVHPADTDTDTDRVWSPLNLNFFRCLRLNLFAFIIYLSLNSLYCHVKAASAPEEPLSSGVGCICGTVRSCICSCICPPPRLGSFRFLLCFVRFLSGLFFGASAQSAPKKKPPVSSSCALVFLPLAYARYC